MTRKTKLALTYPVVGNRNRRARKISKKIAKHHDETRYPMQWRNDWIVKASEKFAKTLKVEVEVIGFDNLPKAPAILAPNHSSMFDPSIMMLALRKQSYEEGKQNHMAVFLAKDDILENKKAKGYADVIDTFYMSRKNPREALKTLDAFTKYAKEEKKFAIVFPEGTRTKDGKLQEFKGGAFRNAKKDFLPVVPVTINGAMAVTDLSRSGKDVVKVQVIFHKPIKPMSLMTSDTKSIAARVQKIVAKDYKNQKPVKNNKAEELV